jgi:hypothetical protein
MEDTMAGRLLWLGFIAALTLFLVWTIAVMVARVASAISVGLS